MVKYTFTRTRKAKFNLAFLGPWSSMAERWCGVSWLWPLFWTQAPHSFLTLAGALFYNVRELVYTHRYSKCSYLPQTTRSQPYLELEALTNAGYEPLSRGFWVPEVWVQAPGGQAHELCEL